MSHLWPYLGPAMREDSVENYFVKRVEEDLGGIALKGAVPGRRFIDRIAILPGGLTVYVEVKRPRGGRFSAHQDETLERLESMGHRVARIKTKNEVDQWAYETKLWIKRSHG